MRSTPGVGQFLTTNEITIMVEITGMDSQSEVRLQQMTRATSRVITATKSVTMQMSTDRNKREKDKAGTRDGKVRKENSSSSKSPRENFLVMAAVEDNGHKAKNDFSGTKYGSTSQEAPNMSS
jgi:hypothetical protein